LAQGIAVAMSKPKTAGNGTNSCRPSGLPKPALHFVEALRHSYGYAARASSRGMTGFDKQNCFHLSPKGSIGPERWHPNSEAPAQRAPHVILPRFAGELANIGNTSRHRAADLEIEADVE